MYAQVVVLTYQAPDIDFFTYKVPTQLEKQIKVGQLVEVPFGKRNPMGIIMSKDERLKTNAKNIKPISNILLEEPLLLPYQIKLLEWMANYYLAPMVNCLEAILPSIPQDITKVRPLSFPRPDLKKTTSQSLILVPSINRIPETLAKFPKAKSYAVYHNELKASEKFTTWIKILNVEVDYIFGSRSAIFTPCPNLREIIIYDEHDSAYKDERSPYFDTITVAQKISELTGAEMKIVDPAPKITTYSALQNRIKIQTFPQSTQIVNMQNERTSGNRSPVSFDLEEEMREILENNGNILLFLNRKKETGHVFCKSCKTSAYLSQQPSACPNCNSPDIFWNVLNVDTLARETKKLFPKASVNLITEGKLPAARDQKPGIDIGTAYALYSLGGKKDYLFVHIQTDSLLNLADFTSGEKFFQQIVQLKKLLTKEGKLILQTNSAEHPMLKSVDKGDYRVFYPEELKARRLLAYPPYSLLVKLTFKGKSDQKVKKLAEDEAKELVTRNQALGTILGPYKSVFWQKLPTYHIILKHKMSGYTIRDREKSIMEISKYLEKDRKKYTIEVEPNSIQ